MALSERGQKVREGAVEEARRLGHRYVGTEHLLLAVSRVGDSTVENILAKLDLEPQDLRDQVDAFVIASGVSHEDPEVPFTPRAEAVIELAEAEGVSLGVEAADPVHILAALAQNEEDVSARVLEVFAIDYASIRRFLA